MCEYGEVVKIVLWLCMCENYAVVVHAGELC